MADGLKNYELVIAIREIEECNNTGVFNEEGMVKKIHAEFENKTGSTQSIKETERAILLEASKRFVQNLR